MGHPLQRSRNDGPPIQAWRPPERPGSSPELATRPCVPSGRLPASGTATFSPMRTLAPLASVDRVGPRSARTRLRPRSAGHRFGHARLAAVHIRQVPPARSFQSRGSIKPGSRRATWPAVACRGAEADSQRPPARGGRRRRVARTIGRARGMGRHAAKVPRDWKHPDTGVAGRGLAGGPARSSRRPRHNPANHQARRIRDGPVIRGDAGRRPTSRGPSTGARPSRPPRCPCCRRTPACRGRSGSACPSRRTRR